MKYPYILLPDLSEDVEAHNWHPDKGGQKEVVIYATLKNVWIDKFSFGRV